MSVKISNRNWAELFPADLSASLLGVSHTALNNWIAAGDIPVVISERGRKEVPIPTLLELQERVEEERKSGRRKLHTLEPIMTETRRRAERSGRGSAVPAPATDPIRIGRRSFVASPITESLRRGSGAR